MNPAVKQVLEKPDFEKLNHIQKKAIRAGILGGGSIFLGEK